MNNTIRLIIKFLMLASLIFLDTDLLVSQVLINNNQAAGGTITNTRGEIRFKTTGQLIDLPSYIGGTVIYQSLNNGTEQIVPNITYNKLIFNSWAWLRVDSFSNTPHASARQLRVLDSFIVRSGDLSKIRSNYVEIHPEANVRTNGVIAGRKDVAMVGLYEKQTILGEDSAVFSNLRIQNPFGVGVEGEFTVEDKLELREGTLYNAEGNVKVGNAELKRSPADMATADTMGTYEENGVSHIVYHREKPLIVRHAGAAIESRADFQEPATDLHYKGQGTIHTGGENPPGANEPIANSKNIGDLRVENTDSLVLTENMRAIDSMYIATHVHTTEDDTLTLASLTNPRYDLSNHASEIQGHHRRSGWADGDTIILNNPYTALHFTVPVDRSQLSTLISTVFPQRYQPLPNGDVTKVKRSLSLHGYNDNNEEYTEKISASYHYGWRYQGNELDETANLAFERLVLMHYNGDNLWLPNNTSVLPPLNNASQAWGYSYAVDLVNFGHYAIGTFDQTYNLAFSGKAFLEGAYRWMPRRMSTELQQYNYLPMPPPDIYPYNLVTDRIEYSRTDGQLPDSVVDWVVLEFRRDFALEGTKKLMLLKADGRIVDMYGNEQVLFHDDGTLMRYDANGRPVEDDITDMESNFYVVLRHRNHSAVISNQPVVFTPGQQSFVDFSLPRNVMGGISSLKPIDKNTIDGSFVYGMLAGDINNNNKPDGLIDRMDYQFIINLMSNPTATTLDGYLLEDINLSGTITTIDFNLIFNNRDKTPILP